MRIACQPLRLTHRDLIYSQIMRLVRGPRPTPL
jgi:hypothetical protein